MKHFFKVLLILFICTANLKANSDDLFKEGYVISLNGDTTKGLLLKQISKNAANQCVFKLNANSESKTYKPGEIAGYRYLDGKYYISKEINIDSINKKLVFLEFLIKGKANIYYYVDNTEHYYIEKLPSDLLELTEIERVHTPNGFDIKDNKSYIIPSKFKGKLMYMLQDCPEINQEIQKARPNHQSLIKLTKDYHEKMCNSENCIIYEKNNISAKLKFGFLVGFSKNQYNFGNQVTSDFGNNYQIGATVKLSNFLMFNENFNLKGSVLFEKDSKYYTLTIADDVRSFLVINNNVPYQLNKKDFGPNSIPYLPSMEAEINVLDLKIPITINYDFNINKKTILNCGVGISNKIIISQNKNFKVNGFYQTYGKSINTLLTGAIATAGVEGNWFGKHTVFVNACYEYLNDFRSHQDNTLKLYNNQFSLQAGMYF